METPHTNTTVSRAPTFRCLPTVSLLIDRDLLDLHLSRSLYQLEKGGVTGALSHEKGDKVELSAIKGSSRMRIPSLFSTLL
jgi:hypothetical protein